MADVEVSDPEVYETGKKVDDRGRVYVGKEFSGERVTIIMERENDD